MLELQDLKDFSIDNWYYKLKHVALETIIIEVSEELLEKFKSDDSSIEFNDLSQEYVEKLKNAIVSLNKECFVKNNWHAPMDAKMFSFGNQLKVTNIDDLFCYLSASTIVSEDFSSINDIPFYLALKPWKNIHPASEFRCIIINNVLRGITPRDWPTYYAHFKGDGPIIIDILSNFFQEFVKDCFSRKHYTFDVIITYPDKPCIVDCGPLNSKTNLYAFSWSEITPLLNKESPDGIPPIFRYLESDMGIMNKADAIYKIANSFT